MHRHRRSCIAIVSALGLPAAAADIHVPGDVPTIQQAIGQAMDGDRVLVEAGVYPELLNFLGKSIVVESVAGAGATVIDGGGSEAFVVTFASGESRGSVLRGFTVTGGLGAMAGNESTGGGIRVIGSSPVVEACIITGNTGLEGGGLSSSGGDALVRATRFEDNAAFFGGGIGAQGGQVTIEDCTFTDNSGTTFGGGLWLAAATGVVTGSTFEGNIAGNLGGAIYGNHATIEASGLRVEGNGDWKDLGGGSRQYTTFGGGGVYTTGSSGRFEASRFVRNGAYAGGGVYVAGRGEIELVNCLIAENITAVGGVYANGSSPRLVNCTIASNETFGLFTTYNSFPDVENSIFTGQTNVASTEIAGNGISRVRYSLIDGDAFSVEFGDGVVHAAARLDSAYAPVAGSPAIDAGDNGAVPEDVSTDLVGNGRFFDDPDTQDTGLGDAPIVDMGAIEFGSSPGACPGDMNFDGHHDTMDFILYLNLWSAGDSAADMNADGRVDTLDFFAFFNAWNEGC